MTPSSVKAAGQDLGKIGLPRRAFIESALDAVNHSSGEVWECGVYRGGSALYIKGCLMEREDLSTDIRLPKTLRLFDTFSGHPESGQWDKHPVGLFGDTSEAEVRARFEGLSDVSFHVGVIPATFAGLDSAYIAFAHIDVDQYKATLDCLAFIYPRMVSGGYILLDDYACPDCPGARRAIDEFMTGKPEALVALDGTQVYLRKA